MRNDYTDFCIDNAFDSYKAILKILSKKKIYRSGYGYQRTVGYIKRLLDDKLLTEIKEKDFINEKGYITSDCKSKIYTCKRTPFVFKRVDIASGEMSYVDLQRIDIINFKDKSDICLFKPILINYCESKNYIPSITLPYYQPDKPYIIYATWDWKEGYVYIKYILTSSLDIIEVDKCLAFSENKYVELERSDKEKVMEVLL